MKVVISIVIPVYNEEKNLSVLYQEIKSVMRPFKEDYEIIFVNDGSTDNSYTILNDINKSDKLVKVIHFDKNYGKTSALAVGFRFAQGDNILTIDGDLQIKPIELARVIKELNSCDAVIGRRLNRQQVDGWIKAVSSKIANYVRNKVLNENIHDAGCSLVGFKKECIKELIIYKDFDTFIPSLIKMSGFNIKEIDIFIYPRRYGRSKYNIRNRIWKLLFALLIVKWMQRNRLNYKVERVL